MRGWQGCYAPCGADPVARQWMRLYCPERLHANDRAAEAAEAAAHFRAVFGDLSGTSPMTQLPSSVHAMLWKSFFWSWPLPLQRLMVVRNSPSSILQHRAKAAEHCATASRGSTSA